METPPLHAGSVPAEQAWKDLLSADEITSREDAFVEGYERDAQSTFEGG